MKEKSKKDLNKGVFGLEITTTQSCNFRCTYCFERCHVPEEKLLDAKIVIKRVKELLDTEWFNELYAGIKIILWGGEPTMNMLLCKTLMEAFRKNERICFFVYTNGSTIDTFMPTLRRLKDQPFVNDNQSKVTIQVSYDGNPIHDMRRLDTEGKGTSLQAETAIDLLHHFGIDYGLKATMTWKDYHLLPEAYEDFKLMHRTYGSKIKYSLTVDYYDVQFDKYRKEVENSLIQVAQKEIKFYKEFGYFLSNIFKNNKAICATGKSMACVNTDGKTYYCHGSIYSKCSEDLQYTSIFSKYFINSIEKANKFFTNDIEPDECKECIAISCLRCNVKKYEESQNRDTFKDSWYDYPAQKDLCEYYRLIGKVSAAIESILRRS